jgi:hypothetical protein
VGVFVEIVVLWIVTFPWYLVVRSQLQAGQLLKRSYHCGPSFLDPNFQRGISYTESEIEAMRTRQCHG